MAIATVSNTGGNWDSTGTWANSSVPTGLDFITFDTGSGPLNVNVSASCSSIDFTNYTNTIDFGATLSVFGSINFGANTYTSSGTFGIETRSSGTLSSAGKTWSSNINFGGSNFPLSGVRYTLSNPVGISGPLQFAGVNGANTCYSTFSGSTLSVGGDVVINQLNQIWGTTSFVYAGTGTWTTKGLTDFNCNFTVNTDGTLTFAADSGTVFATDNQEFIFNRATFSYIKGNVVTNGSILYSTTPITLNSTNGTNSIYWDRVQLVNIMSVNIPSDLYVTATLSVFSGLTFSGAGRILFTNPSNVVTGGLEFWNSLANSRFGTTLPHSFTVSNLTLGNGSTNTVLLRNNNIFVNRDFRLNIGSGVNGFSHGSTKINLIGTGTWSSGAGTLRNDVVINTSGQINISGDIPYQVGTISYQSGTVNTIGGNLIINATASLQTSTSSSAIYWDRISFTSSRPVSLVSDLYVTGTMSFLLGTTSFSGRSVLFTDNNNVVRGSLSISPNVTHVLGQFFTVSNLELGTSISTAPITLTGNRISILGNLTSNASSTTPADTPNRIVSGSTTLFLVGTGSWNHPNSGGYIRNNVIINSTGTITLQNVYYDTGSFTYSSGTIVSTSSVININNSASLNLSGFTWSQVNLETGSGLITLNGNLNGQRLIFRGGPTWTGSGRINLDGGLEVYTNGSVAMPNSFTASYFICGTSAASSTTTINSNTVSVTGNLTVLSPSNGVVTGTTNILLSGTGTWSNPSNGTLRNNLTIDTVGVIYLTASTINYNTGTFRVNSGSFSAGSSTFSVQASTTFATEPVSFNTLLFTASTITLSSKLRANKLVLSGSVTFAGTSSFDVSTLNTSNTSAATHIFVSGNTYNVNSTFTCSENNTFRSSVGGSQSIFTVGNGSICDLPLVNVTDIDSSQGRTLWTWRGVINNSSNWQLLPTEPRTIIR